jgi:Lon protease-like protein
MKHIHDLPETIPIFPLPGALLLPRARLPLHIFEPRYLQMLEDCMKTSERLIGMIQTCAAPARMGGGEPRLHSIGCAGRLTEFSETGDGRYMVTLAGVSRFRLREEVSGFTPYRRARVEWREFERDQGQAEEDPDFNRKAFMALLQRFFVTLELSTDWGGLKEANTEMMINSLSMLCPFSPEDKQALLEARTLTTRREIMVTLIEFALRSGSGEEIMQ